MTVREYWIRPGARGDGSSRDSPSADLHGLLGRAERGSVFRIARGEYHGEDGAGEFAVGVPNLTLAGGYDRDFVERNPFIHLTVLRRRPGFTAARTSPPGGIVCMERDDPSSGRIVSCSGLVLDGLVLDGAACNTYDPGDGRLLPGASGKEPLVKLAGSGRLSCADVRIRNCLVVNGSYQGVYAAWAGSGNEIVNCLIVNNRIDGVDATAASGPGPRGNTPGASLRIEGCTIAFTWEHDRFRAGRGISVAPGCAVERCVIAYLQGSSREGIRRSRPNPKILDNVFWATAEADSGRVPEGNFIRDPGFHPEPDYFEAFTGYAAASGVMPLEVVDRERRTRGLPALDGARLPPPSAFAYGRALPVSLGIFESFASRVPGAGFRTDFSFAEYEPAVDRLPGSEAGPSDEYRRAAWKDLADRAKAAGAVGTRVAFEAVLSPRRSGPWPTKRGITAADYAAFELREPGGRREGGPERIAAFFLSGSRAARGWNRLLDEVGGGPKAVRLAGTLFEEGSAALPRYFVAETIEGGRRNGDF